MSSVTEKAIEWNYKESTVRSYCASGIIPPASKEGTPKKWYIPEDWPKPPMTRHGLCFLMHKIYQLNNGVEYNDLNMGYPIQIVKAGYRYLMSAAFITHVNVDDLVNTLKLAVVTSDGEKLIERENRERNTQFRAHVNVQLKLGALQLGAGVEV